MIKVVLTFEVLFENTDVNIGIQKKLALESIQSTAQMGGWKAVVSGIEPTLEVFCD
jgi:hypothetical protein